MNKLFLVAIFGGLMAGSVNATLIGLWSTGVCSGQNTTLNTSCSGASGSLLNYGSSGGSVFDNNYKMTARVDGGTVGTNSSSTEHAISTYVADGVGASEWIGPSPLGANEQAGAYTFATTFDLTGFDPTSLILSLDVSADNSVQVLINNHDISSTFNYNGTGSPNCGATSAAAHPWCFENFSSNHNITNAVASGFLATINTLTFVVTNEVGSGPNPTGLRVQAVGSANLASGVPEPITVALVGFGLAGMALVRRRRA